MKKHAEIKIIADSKLNAEAGINSDQPLLSNNFADLYATWVTEEFRYMVQGTNCQRVAFYLGGGCGAITSLLSSRIAYEFGASLTDSIPPPILGVIFGSITGCTVGSALVFVSADILHDDMRPAILAQKILVGEHCANIKQASKKTAMIFITLGVSAIGLIASLDMTYLMDSLYSNALKQAVFLFDVPTLLTTFVISNWSLNMQLSNFYNFMRRNVGPIFIPTSSQRIEKELFLEKVLYSALTSIAKLNNDQIDMLHLCLGRDSQSTESVLEKLNELLSSSLKTNDETLKKHNEEKVLQSTCNKFSGYLGSIVGAVSPYFTLAITQDAAKWICNMLGIVDENAINNFSQFLGWSALITTSALSAYTTKLQFAKIQSIMANVTRTNCMEMVDKTACAKLVLAGVSTTYRLKLTLDVLKDSGLWKIPVGICSVLGPFSTYYWGMDIAKAKLQGVNKRDQLQEMVIKMIQLLPKMENRYLFAFYQHVQGLHNSRPLHNLDKNDNKFQENNNYSEDTVTSPPLTPQFKTYQTTTINNEKTLLLDSPKKNQANKPPSSNQQKFCSIM